MKDFKMLKKATLSMILLTTINGFAQQADAIPLYKGTIPGVKPAPADYKETQTADLHIGKVVNPTLLPFFPEKGKANGTAIIICPGGGYAFLSYDKEGIAVAKKFAEAGVTAFVLKYRLPSDQIMADRSVGPLQDAQRALQMVRENAVKWGVNPEKVGIIGFSAGGHLASTAVTHYDKPVIILNEGTNVRPDFAVLVYPVITMGEYTHQGSKINLIGKDAPADKVTFFRTKNR